MATQDEMRKKLDEMLLQKAGLTRVSSNSYRNLTSLPIEDLKAQLVGQIQNNNTPVVQQDIKQQQNTQQPITPEISTPTGQELLRLASAANATTPEQRADVLGKYNTAAGSDFDRMIQDTKNRALHDRVNAVSGSDRVKQILIDRLTNHYGGSRYTDDQFKAAQDLAALQQQEKQASMGLSAADKERALNEQKLQELKNQGLIETAKAKGNGGGKTLPASQAKSISGLASVVSQLDGFEQRYSDPKLAGIFGIGGRMSRFVNSVTQTDPILNQYKQDIGMLKRFISKEIEGGRMSDQDRQYYDETLFNPNATQESFINALNYYKAQKESEYNQYLDIYQKAGYDVSGLMDIVGNAQKNIESASGIKKFELNGESYEIPSDDSEAIQEILAAGGKQLE